MQTIAYAHILLENNTRALQYPLLYCRATGKLTPNGNDEWSFEPHGSYDFMTYFNALSVSKLREYTSAEKFMLHLEYKGGPSLLYITRADVYAHEPSKVGEAIVLEESENWSSIDLELPDDPDVVLASFILETQDHVVELRHGRYDISFAHEENSVELALATTTFKKEKFITGNIARVKEELFNSGEDISHHLHMFVIDNGRTLPYKELSDEHVTVIPNQNVGGAGGFTRGMIEAMESPRPTTHVLLMDDDISISVESIRRTYNLLRAVNQKYSQAMVSGTMLNYLISNFANEDTGFMTPDGAFMPIKPPLNMDLLEDLVFNETFVIPKDVKDYQRYAAWWYCCIPVSVIHRIGLPLPYFVRADDGEYGTRARVPFMTMNGIGVWHMPFNVRYNPAVERYQTVRNVLIASFTTGFAPDSDFVYPVHNFVRLELKKFAYANARLVLDAFEDFLKGPEFYSAKGMAEKTFLAANKNAEKLVSYAELDRQAQQLGINFKSKDYTRQIIDSDKPRNYFQRLTDYVTDNGQRFIHSQGDGYVVIPQNGWVYPAGVIRGKKYIIAVDWYNRKGVIREKNIKEFKAIQSRYRRDMRYFKAHEKELHERYEASRARVTSLEFWKNYLDMD